MRHPNNAFGKKRVCPITKTQFYMCWSNHDKPGVYNECDECQPGQPTLGQRLAKLNEKKGRGRRCEQPTEMAILLDCANRGVTDVHRR